MKKILAALLRLVGVLLALPGIYMTWSGRAHEHPGAIRAGLIWITIGLVLVGVGFLVAARARASES